VSSYPLDDYQKTPVSPPLYRERDLTARALTPSLGVVETARNEQVRSQQNDRLRFFFSRLIIVLFLVLVGEVIFQFILAPRMVITSVVIDAPRGFPMTNEQIMQAAGFTGTLGYFSIDTGAAESRLARVPRIAEAMVSKEFPGRLHIVLEERLPLAYSLISSDSGMIPLVLDKHGVIFSVGRGSIPNDLPVVSGVRFPEIREGMRLPDPVLPFLDQLHQLSLDAPQLFGLISEVKFEKRGLSDYDVVLYPRGYQTRVRIGREISAELLKYILVVLDVTRREGINSTLEELDFRSSRIVYRTREE
jgi:cell division protein FtsQ